MSTVHNPVNFEPANYNVEDYLDNKRPQYCGGDVDQFRLDIKFWEEDMARVLGADWRAKSHRCVHCGNTNIRWITAVRYLPTNDVVVFGSDCTDRLGFPNKVAFKLALLKSRADKQAESFKAYQAKQAFLAANPDVAAAVAEVKDPVHAKNLFALDVIAKFERYGSLSPRQIDALVKSLARDRETAARKAVEAVEIKGDAPTGRQTVTGEVLSTKVQDSDFGPVRKMLVKLTNNSKVWLTVPGGSGIERGDVITFKATFEPSRDDKSFGFGKRPQLVEKKAGVTV